MSTIKIKENHNQEKLRGGYYTPSELTDYITRYIIENTEEDNIKILEPSVGDGEFYNSFKKYNINFTMTGIELFEEEAIKAIQRVENDSRFITINKDFYEFYDENRKNEYQVVVGNPPYIRYQLLSEKQRDYQSEILINNGLKVNRLINSWVAFTVASIELLAENGIFAFVLPTDLLQVSYAKGLRSFLYNELSIMNVINFEKTVFEDIQQDVLLIIGKKKNNKDKINHQLRIINISNKEDLLNLEIEKLPIESAKSIKSFYKNDKWSSVFINKKEREFYYNLRMNNNVSSFNDYIVGQVGITTGNNKIFAVSDEKIKEYDLKDYAIPLLGRSVEAAGITYENKDLEENKSKGKNIWLLDFNNKKIKDKSIDYIKLAEKNNEHKGYKLSLRDKWYEVPSIWTPDAFLLRRIGSHPKIILNKLNATSTDTFHRLVFKEGVNHKLVMISLYSSLSLMTYELEARVFAGGALEILPGDLKNIYLPKLDFEKSNHKIDKIFDELDIKMRNKVNIKDIVSWVDRKLLTLGYPDYYILKESNKIWRKIRYKRLSK